MSLRTDMLAHAPRPAAGREARVIDTALLHAAQEGDAPAVASLLAEGARVDARTDDGWTPLMVAVINGHAGVVRHLLACGADVNARNGRGWTALRFAVSMGDTDAVRLLLEAGADPDARDEDGRTALMQAAEENVLECVRALVEAGADVSLRDGKGETSLAIAARAGYAPAVEILIVASAQGPGGVQERASRGVPGEGELNRLREEFAGAIGSVVGEEAGLDPAPTETLALAPAQPPDLVERLVLALEAMRDGDRPAHAAALSAADLAHKLLLTIGEAAALSGLSRGHLLKAVRGGNLVAKKIGRGWRVRREDLEAYVRNLF